MEFDPQVWAQVGVIGVAFGWLLWWVTTRLQAALERNTEAIDRLARQVSLNTIALARLAGQDPSELESMLANGGGR